MRFVILEGSIKTLNGVVKKGETIELEAAEAKLIDPTGTVLIEQAKYEAGIKAEAAKKAAYEKALKDAAEAAAKAEADAKAKAKADGEKGGK